MAGRYDTVTKRLLEIRPSDWVRLLGFPEGPVSLVDADLSTVSLAADRLIRVDAATPYVLHNELESGHHTHEAPRRMLTYNAIVGGKTGLPVLSTVFVLRRESNSPRLTGTYHARRPDGSAYLTFEYGVVRVWELNVTEVLSGGVSTLPFAPIADVPRDALPAVVREMERRIDAEVPDEYQAGELWVATYVLLGLKYEKPFNAQLLKGVRRMKESVTYQAILEEGRVEGLVEGELREARRILLRVGAKRLGEPAEVVSARIQAVESREELETLIERVAEVESWGELFGEVGEAEG
jgi:hypothetical protein